MNQDKLKEIINSINERLALHGGSVDLVDFDGKKKIVKLRLQGACGHCPMAQLTSENFIKKELLAKMPDLKEIMMVG
ncbi:MAG: NifU family protein [Patescibacteria group bacterium]|nr:NifU family protein [Patescibacteria group bacterium]